MPLSRKEIQRRYGSHSVNPYDYVRRRKDEEGNELPFETYGEKAYDIMDELNLPLLYQEDGVSYVDEENVT